MLRPATEQELIDLLHQADGQPIGLRVATQSPQALAEHLIAARKVFRKTKRSAFRDLVFVRDPSSRSHLMIIKSSEFTKRALPDAKKV